MVNDRETDSITIVPRCVLPRDAALRTGSRSRPDIETEAMMGDRSPKSKQRDQKQRDAAKASDTAAAKSKQDAQSRASLQPKARK
jgi:hypothetical protein